MNYNFFFVGERLRTIQHLEFHGGWDSKKLYDDFVLRV